MSAAETMAYVDLTFRLGDTIPFLLTMATDETGSAWLSFEDYVVEFVVKQRTTDADADALAFLDNDEAGGIATPVASVAAWSVPTVTGFKAVSHVFYALRLRRISTGSKVTLQLGRLFPDPATPLFS